MPFPLEEVLATSKISVIITVIIQFTFQFTSIQYNDFRSLDSLAAAVAACKDQRSTIHCMHCSRQDVFSSTYRHFTITVNDFGTVDEW